MGYETLEVFHSRFLELLTVHVRESDIMWIIAPLLIATVLMYIYFQKYKDEELGWNSAVANSLVSLFVSITLLRHIYFISPPGSTLNFIDNMSKTVFALLLLFSAFVLLIINFEHMLPKKIAYHISSPLTTNLISYIVILFVYSNMIFDSITFITLLIFFLLLRIILYIIQSPIDRFFNYMRHLKEQERIKDLEKARKKIREEKKVLEKKEKKIKQTAIKQLEKEKKEIKRVKKALKKK